MSPTFRTTRSAGEDAFVVGEEMVLALAEDVAETPLGEACARQTATEKPTANKEGITTLVRSRTSLNK